MARRRNALDRVIVEGVDLAEDPALALRARQLTDHSTRAALANSLRNLVDAAEEPLSSWGRGGPRPPLQRRAVRAARGDLLALVALLRQPDRVSPRAAALAAQLVWDSASPMYAPGGEATVAEVVRTILDFDRGPGGGQSAP